MYAKWVSSGVLPVPAWQVSGAPWPGPAQPGSENKCVTILTPEATSQHFAKKPASNPSTPPFASSN